MELNLLPHKTTQSQNDTANDTNNTVSNQDKSDQTPHETVISHYFINPANDYHLIHEFLTLYAATESLSFRGLVNNLANAPIGISPCFNNCSKDRQVKCLTACYEELECESCCFQKRDEI